MDNQICCLKAKISLHKKEKLNEWIGFLKEQQKEVIETMKSEGVQLEAIFFEKEEKHISIYYFIQADSLEYAKQIYKNSKREIDLKHRTWQRELFEKKEYLTPLYFKTSK